MAEARPPQSTAAPWGPTPTLLAPRAGPAGRAAAAVAVDLVHTRGPVGTRRRLALVNVCGRDGRLSEQRGGGSGQQGGPANRRQQPPGQSGPQVPTPQPLWGSPSCWGAASRAQAGRAAAQSLAGLGRGYTILQGAWTSPTLAPGAWARPGAAPKAGAPPPRPLGAPGPSLMRQSGPAKPGAHSQRNQLTPSTQTPPL